MPSTEMQPKGIFSLGVIVVVNQPEIREDKMMRSSREIRKPPENLDEYAEDSPDEVLGIGAADIADLIRKGIVGS